MKRPSHKELTKKIREAKEAVSERRIEIVEPIAVTSDALELGYLIEELPNILSEVLDEVTPYHYAGTRPPQHSYEEKIKDCELFAFRWESKHFGCDVYLKFTLKDDLMWLVSLHVHREGGGE